MKHVYRVFVLLLLLSGIVLTAVAQSATPMPSDPVLTAEEIIAETEASRAVIEAYYEAQAGGNLDEIFAFLSPDSQAWTLNGPPEPIGYEETVGFFTAFRTAIPNLEITVHDIIAEGDKVVVRFTLTGTYAVEFAGQSAGTEFVQDLITIYRVEDGLIVEAWS
jgi:predicted ester cyclase